MAELRREAAALGHDVGHLTHDQLGDLLSTCRGDVDFCCIALGLDPRPPWVAGIVGLVPTKPT